MRRLHAAHSGDESAAGGVEIDGVLEMCGEGRHDMLVMLACNPASRAVRMAYEMVRLTRRSIS